MRALLLFVLFATAATGAFAQVEWQESIDQWHQKHPRVTPFAILPQRKFLPGDTVRYQLLLLTEGMERIAGRRILRCTLVNSRGKICATSEVGVKNGSAFSQLSLPDTLHQGFYRLAWDNDWMNIHQPGYYFEEEIEIVTDKKLEVVSVDVTRFYPEGGHLVAGVTNKVVATGRPGTVGELTDGKGSALTQVRFNEAGLGFFIFTPQAGERYQLQRTDLPAADSEGVAMLVSAQAGGRVRVVCSVAPTQRSTPLYLIARGPARTYFINPLTVGDQGVATVQWAAGEFPSGVLLLSVISADGREWAQRSVFLRAASDHMRLSLTESSVSGRGILSMQTETAKEAWAFSWADHLTQEEQTPLVDFSEELLLSLSGFDHLSYRRHRANESTLDLWMITQQPFPVNWTEALHDSDGWEPMPELLTRSAKAFFVQTGAPLPDSCLVRLYLEKQMNSYEARVIGGKVAFYFLFDFFGEEDLYYETEYKGSALNGVRLEWVEPEWTYRAATPSRASGQDDAFADHARKRKAIQNSYQYFNERARDAKSVQDPNALLEDELAGADITVRLDDYVAFPGMNDVVKEIIPAMRHRTQRGVSTIRVVLSEPGRLTYDDPLYVIDGIVTRNTTFFMSLKPTDVISIKIVNNLHKLTQFGPMGKNGIVLVHTRGIDLSSLRAGNPTLLLHGLTRTSPWVAPVVDGNTSRIPDFRDLVWWQPFAPVAREGSKFRVSDQTGTLRVHVLGITVTGEPFSLSAEGAVFYKKD